MTKRRSPLPTPADILREYDLVVPLYSQFAERVCSLATELLRQASLPVHSVTCRVKARPSLARKLERPGAQYGCLGDVTDVAGVRITTYFGDDVDRVASVIAKEFSVDRVHSVDKRAALDPDRFGYLSLHHIVELSPERRSLPEYAMFRGLKAEIQTRSILQHAWAEIEHDLGYKVLSDVPRNLRRRFSQIAGLLEIADQEFERLREELRIYQNSLPVRIVQHPEDVPFDKESVVAFVEHNPTVARIDGKIARAIDRKLTPDGNHMHAVRRLSALRLTNFKKIEMALDEHADAVVKLASGFLAKGDESKEGIASGISLFYLCYAVGASRGEKALLKMLQRAKVPMPERLAAYVLNVLAQDTRASLTVPSRRRKAR